MRVEELFQQAWELAPEDRDAFLVHASGGDQQLRKAVSELLASLSAVEAAPGWNTPAIQLEADAIQPSSELSRYSLAERIGAGGMGVVYKATRADDAFSKLVAVKIVQAVDPVAVARFQQERQILASLEHPNIARLLDGGSTPEGLPFLVMEFIEGVTIDQYIAQTKPTQRELLELFRKICSAVSYAHAKLIVHRDLKPGNILVTPAGEPKLLDFGVAKVLDGTADRTKTGGGALTPEYASPEQILGAPITTASDIYSLGVLLYELLSGVRLYQSTTNAMELAAEICTRDPQPLTVRARKHFDPDLERIVQMALRKEPERRYPSVEQFSEDIRRYLEGYPVQARPSTRGYLVSKFVRRNRFAIGAAVLLLLTLGGGIAATLHEARLANRRFNDVRKLANAYLFEFYDGIRDVPGTTAVRHTVVKRALEYLDSLSAERGNDVALGNELAAAYKRVGDAQGAPNWPSLGDRAGALVSYRKALAIREGLRDISPANRELVAELADNHWSICDIQMHSGEVKQAAVHCGEAVAIMEKQLGAKPGTDKERDVLANAYIGLGDVLGSPDVQSLGKPKEAVEIFKKALVIRQNQKPGQGFRFDRRVALALTHGKLASVYQSLNELPLAAQSLRQAIALDEQLLQDFPTNVLYRRETAVYNRSLSLVLIRMNQLPEAEQRGNRSAQLFEQLVAIDPNNISAKQALAESTYSQGYVQAKLNHDAVAMRLYDLAFARYEQLRAIAPGSVGPGLRHAYQLMGELALKMANPAKAMEAARKQLEITNGLLKKDAANAGARRFKGTALTQMGNIHQFLAKQNHSTTEWKDARAWYQQALDIWLDLQQKGTLVPLYANRPEEARKLIAACDEALTH